MQIDVNQREKTDQKWQEDIVLISAHRTDSCSYDVTEEEKKMELYNKSSLQTLTISRSVVKWPFNICIKTA